MKKAIVIGCPGSGKSYFAKKLHDATGFPLYHLDMIWHKPDKTHISREEFDETLKKNFFKRRMDYERRFFANYGNANAGLRHNLFVRSSLRNLS